MSNNPTGALLALDDVDEFARQGVLVDFWRKVLELYVASHCDGFALSGFHSAEELSKVTCFADWQPSPKGRATVRLEWDVPAGKKWHDLDLTLFPLDVEVIGRLYRPQFQYWSASSDDYPADHLYFFSGAQLLIDAEPNELAILFYELTSARRDLLWSIEPSVVRALDFSRNWIATTLTVSEATKER